MKAGSLTAVDVTMVVAGTSAKEANVADTVREARLAVCVAVLVVIPVGRDTVHRA